MSVKVAVAFHSVSGRTRALSEAVIRGARSVEGVDAVLVDVDVGVADRAATARVLATLSEADAIVFGCPTYMGSASGVFKTFMDGTSAIWALQGWKDKLAAGFTHSAALSGDKLGTLTQLAVFAAQHGMVWIGLGLPPTYASAGESESETNRLGSHLGAMGQSRPGGGVLPGGDLRTAELLGERVALAARRWGVGPSVASRESGASGRTSTSRHPTAQTWAFPPADRAPLAAGIERVNLRELAARPERFEHHLLVCATLGGAQLEVAVASEPLYFAHINLSDEFALALPTGDDLIDRFPLRTFLSDATTGEDVGRYNHRIGDLVLHPFGYLHWPGRLRPPFEPFEFPPGMRRTGLSLVYCASTPTPGAAAPEIAPERRDDAKAYATPSPPMSISASTGAAGRVASVGVTSLDLVVRPGAIAPARGAFVVVLEAEEGPFFACDLVRVPAGASLDGRGIVRALVLSSDEASPDAVPSTWERIPEAPFSTYESSADAPTALPLSHGGLVVAESTPSTVTVSLEGVAAEVPRYWLARMLYRVALHGRLGYVETYGGFFVDDREGRRVGIRTRDRRVSIVVAEDDHLAFVERLYRAVAPQGYVERLA